DGSSYNYQEGSSLEMDILGCFLSSDVEWGTSSYKQWLLNDPNLSASGNLTSLHKDNDLIIMKDLYPDKDGPPPVELTVRQEQLLQLLNEWEEKVCKVRPSSVVIKYENDEFIFEIKE